MPTMVMVELVADECLDESGLRGVRAALEEIGGVVVVGPDGVQLTVTIIHEDAEGLVDAVRRGVEMLADLLPGWRPIQVDAMTPERQAQVLTELPFLDLVGLDEVAEIIGVSRQRAAAIARGAAFPVPAALLISGPVWFAEAVQAWASTGATTGRPPRHLKAVSVVRHTENDGHATADADGDGAGSI